jgi:hypothetical protein
MSGYPPELSIGIIGIGLLILVEGVAIGVWLWKTGRGARLAGILFTLGAGFFLVVALGLVLGGASIMLVLAALCASWFAHLADLVRRLREVTAR